MNIINKISVKIRRKAIRFYDFHYMVRYYGEIGNGYGDFMFQIFVSFIIWLAIFCGIFNPLFSVTVHQISDYSFIFEFMLCYFATLFLFWNIDSRIYEKGERADMLDKVWKIKSKEINRLMLFIEHFLFGMIFFLSLCYYFGK